jgi:hypothetical protein
MTSSSSQTAEDRAHQRMQFNSTDEKLSADLVHPFISGETPLPPFPFGLFSFHLCAAHSPPFSLSLFADHQQIEALSL